MAATNHKKTMKVTTKKHLQMTTIPMIITPLNSNKPPISPLMMIIKFRLNCKKKTEDIDTEESFCRLWYNQGKDKYETYKDILPHLFDTASDVGAVLEFYTLWTILTNASGLDDRLSIRAVFFASIFIIIFFKTVSAFTIYYITKNPWDILWQYLDVMLVKCVYYGRSFEEPTYLENYLALLETLFEAAPEMIISLAFMIRTVEPIPVIVVLSFLFSLFMLSSTLTDEDELRFSEGTTVQKLEFVQALKQSVSGITTYVYSHDSDTNGVLYAIATQFGDQDWQNPHWKR
eukprot:646126_1